MFKNNRDYINANMESSMEMGMGMNNMDTCSGENYPGVVCPPVYECPQERVCHRYICHEVPQDCTRYVIQDGILFDNTYIY